jgi:hypothetical protein
MYAHPPRQPTHAPPAARKAGARVRRLACVLAAATCGLLASAAVVPEAFAMTAPGGQGGTGVAPTGSARTVRVITTGGMAGWQITLIALGAALLAAAATLLLERVLITRRAASATTA